MKIKPFYKWYDLWIGAYYDTKKRRLYLCFFGLGVCIYPLPHFKCPRCGGKLKGSNKLWECILCHTIFAMNEVD